MKGKASRNLFTFSRATKENKQRRKHNLRFLKIFFNAFDILKTNDIDHFYI
jgi:hypothetical protein